MLSRLSIGGQAQVSIAVATEMMFVAFSVSGIQRQIEFGPGQYLDTFKYAADNSSGNEVTITNIYDFRYTTVLYFYKLFIRSNKNIYLHF
jgi:hypothetical protein